MPMYCDNHGIIMLVDTIIIFILLSGIVCKQDIHMQYIHIHIHMFTKSKDVALRGRVLSKECLSGLASNSYYNVQILQT